MDVFHALIYRSGQQRTAGPPSLADTREEAAANVANFGFGTLDFRRGVLR